MPRIRTIKPEFFRDEDLQDLEAANPGKHVMLVFAGLWGHCDKAGRFKWLPRSLKLDILPFLEFDMAQTLGVLQNAGFVRRYEVDGAAYGIIPTFGKHQRIGGKEAQEPERFPAPASEEKQKRARKPREAKANDQGSNGEAPEQYHTAQEEEREGKGKEGEGNGIGAHTAPPLASPAPEPPIPDDPLKADDEMVDDAPAPVVASRGKRLEPDWMPSADEIGFCRTQRPDLDVGAVADEFRDYWIAQPGQKGVKLDWSATWRNWVRRQRQGQRPNGRSRTMQALDELERRAAS